MKSWVAGFVGMSLMLSSTALGGLMLDSGFVADQYWGGHVNSNREVLGNDPFQITYSRVQVSDTQLKFTIVTSFADNPAQSNARLGDLFFTFDGYDPYGTGPEYKSDNITNGTKWTYGLELQNIPTSNSTFPASGAAELYGLGSYSAAYYSSDSVITSSEYWHSLHNYGGTIREGQEVQVRSSGLTAMAIDNADWATGNIDFVDVNSNSFTNKSALTITLNVADVATTFGLDPVNSNINIAYHWAMTCGNDTVENSSPVPYFEDAPPTAPVPEPATAFAFGFGLLGLVITHRRRKEKNA